MFENLEQRDSGKYECYHTFTKDSIVIDMDVAIPITFMDTPERQEAKEFSNTTLRCEVAGKPDPEVHWSVGDRPITQGKKWILLWCFGMMEAKKKGEEQSVSCR